jgi:hypothetical protein
MLTKIYTFHKVIAKQRVRLKLEPIGVTETYPVWAQIRAQDGNRYLCYYTDRYHKQRKKWHDKEDITFITGMGFN